jgi:hypothetical protein
MPNHITRTAIIKRLEDGRIREKLEELESDPRFQVQPTSYSANTTLYPDGQIPFVEKHMAYLMDHPKLDPEHYLSNLRLMLIKRG